MLGTKAGPPVFLLFSFFPFSSHVEDLAPWNSHSALLLYYNQTELGITVCVCRCVCVHAWVGIYAHVCGGERLRPHICFSPSLPLYDIGSLTEPEVTYSARVASQTSLWDHPISISYFGLQECAPHLAHFVDTGDHSCAVSTLPTEPSSETWKLCFVFCFIFSLIEIIPLGKKIPESSWNPWLIALTKMLINPCDFYLLMRIPLALQSSLLSDGQRALSKLTSTEPWCEDKNRVRRCTSFFLQVISTYVWEKTIRPFCRYFIFLNQGWLLLIFRKILWTQPTLSLMLCSSD